MKRLITIAAMLALFVTILLACHHTQAATISSPAPNPVLTSPPSGCHIPAGRIEFSWDKVDRATDYWLDVGTAESQGDIFAAYTGGDTRRTVDLSKFTGRTIYVQLYSRTNGIVGGPGTGNHFIFHVGLLGGFVFLCPAI